MWCKRRLQSLHRPHAGRLQNARFRVRRLDFLRIAPVGAGRNVEPRFVLGDILRAGRAGAAVRRDRTTARLGALLASASLARNHIVFSRVWSPDERIMESLRRPSGRLSGNVGEAQQ
jgi:hypothetical protein